MSDRPNRDRSGQTRRQFLQASAMAGGAAFIPSAFRFDEALAQGFCRAVADTVFDAILSAPEPDEGVEWEVQCRERMVPTHANITATETRLAEVAEEFGGYPDGWGSLSNPDGSPAD